jgi:hypothetical protein
VAAQIEFDCWEHTLEFIFMKSIIALLGWGILVISSAIGAESRTWIVTDGRVVVGTLQKVAGNTVFLVDGEGKVGQFERSTLSLGDNEVIKAAFPEGKAPMGGVVVSRMPEPAKLAKIDTKAFKGGGIFHLGTESWEVLETAHFKVIYQKPVDPKDVAELAERMWFDAAYVYPAFSSQFSGVKMAIFLAPTDGHYDRIGKWYGEMLAKGGQGAEAIRMAAVWAASGSASMFLPSEVASGQGVMEYARSMRAYRKGGSAAAKVELIKGVWEPFFVHCLAEDMIHVQAGGLVPNGRKGYYALCTGHAYYKEVDLTGKCESGLVRTQSISGKDVSTVGGLADPNHWPGELKKLVKKGEVKATLETIRLMTLEGADAKANVLAYGWSRYLERSLPALVAYGKLLGQIRSGHQMPEAEELAKIYGFSTATAMEEDFQKWLQSPDFH